MTNLTERVFEGLDALQVVFFEGSQIREIRLSVLMDCPSLLLIGVNSDYLQCTRNNTLGLFVNAKTLTCGCTAKADELIEGPPHDPILRCIPKFNLTTALSTTFSMRSSTTSSDSHVPGAAGTRGGEFKGAIVAGLVAALLIFILAALILVQRCVVV